MIVPFWSRLYPVHVDMYDVRNHLVPNHFDLSEMAFDVLGNPVDVFVVAERKFKILFSRGVRDDRITAGRLSDDVVIGWRDEEHTAAILALYFAAGQFFLEMILVAAVFAFGVNAHGPLSDRSGVMADSIKQYKMAKSKVRGVGFWVR